MIRACRQLLTAERGAALWVPGLLGVAFLVLFAMRLAPGGTSLFTRVTARRVILGTWAPAPGAESAAAALTAELALRLGSFGDFTVVDPQRVTARMASVSAPGTQSAGLVHAARPLNAHWIVDGTVAPAPGGFDGSAQVFDARTDAALAAFRVQGADPAALGAALADSLHTLSQAPQIARP